MALVDYSSSDEEEKESLALKDNKRVALKRKREDESVSDLPPLPSKFHDLYASTARISTRDDPALHGGRKRVTPHIEGNWPTHIYLEWYPSAIEYDSLNKITSAIEGRGHPSPEIYSFLTSDLGAPLPLHVSLSRPIGLSSDEKENFGTSLEQAINSSRIRPFDAGFSGLDWVPNFENTRWFLVLRMKRPETDGLNQLLHVSNDVVQKYGQPPLYSKKAWPENNGKRKKGTAAEQPQPTSGWPGLEDLSHAFHISIAWMLKPPNEEILNRTKSLSVDHLDEINQIQFKVRDIKAKVGNVVTSIPLPTTVSVGRSLFGV